jgi:hypothetical protein
MLSPLITVTVTITSKGNFLLAVFGLKIESEKHKSKRKKSHKKRIEERNLSN